MSSALQTIKHAVHSVPAGFPAAANESSHEQVSLDSYLVSNPSTTVFFRVRGESMTGAGIFDGDLLVVDRSIEPVHGQVVVAAINNDMTVKRLYKRAGELKLQADRRLSLMTLIDSVLPSGKDLNAAEISAL